MIDYIDAPMPYIIGVPREIWKKIKKEKGRGYSWLPPDVSVLDIDKGMFKIKETLPDLPAGPTEKAYNFLLEVLNESKDVQSMQVSINKLKFSYTSLG